MRFLQIHRVTPKTGAKRRANENSLFIGGAYCAVLTIFWGVSPPPKKVTQKRHLLLANKAEI